MTTERPTAAEMREMALKIGDPDIHAAPDGYADVNAAFLKTVAHTLRCAAEDAEKMQEMREALAALMSDIETWGVDDYQFESCHRARTLLGGTR